MDGRHKIFTRSRVLFLLLALVLLGAMGASVFALTGVLRHRREQQREQAERQLDHLLQQSVALTDGYFVERESRREDIRNILKRQAGAVCADIEVFLQAALIRRQAEKNHERMQQEMSRKKELMQLLQNHIERSATLVQKAISNTEQAEKKDAEEKNGSVSGDGLGVEKRDVDSFFGSPTVSDASGEQVNHAKVELEQLVKKLEGLQEETGKMADPLADDKADAEIEGWQQRLLRESGADIENLLPENSMLTVSPVGGRILLAIGGGKSSPEAIRAEATRSMLLNSSGNPLQWVIRVVLVETAAPLRPNARELSAKLALLSTANGYMQQVKVDGFITDAEGKILQPFPESNHSTILPKAGRWNTYTDKSILYRQSVAANGWQIGLRLTLDTPDTRRQLEQIARAYPAYAVLFCVAQTVFLFGLIYLGVLSWRANNGIVVAHATGGASAAGNAGLPLKAQLGSLSRLQKANRGRAGSNGSRILELAKSPVLRQLAAKVRSVDPAKPSKEKPSLRQYKN